MMLRHRALPAGAGLTVVIALLWFGVLAPKRHEATDLGASVSQAEEARSDAVGRAAAGDAARATYSRDYATVARVGKAVPTRADVPSLVYQLENAARVAKVDLRSLALETASAAAAPAATDAIATTTPGGVAPTPFTFTLEGTYFGVRRLLGALGRFARVSGKNVSVSGRLLTLDTMKISPGRRGLPQIKAEVTAKAYVAQMPALPGKAPSLAAPAATVSSPTSAPAAQATP
jgi:hypothetical protein